MTSARTFKELVYGEGWRSFMIRFGLKGGCLDIKSDRFVTITAKIAFGIPKTPTGVILPNLVDNLMGIPEEVFHWALGPIANDILNHEKAKFIAGLTPDKIRLDLRPLIISAWRAHMRILDQEMQERMEARRNRSAQSP